MIGYSVKATYGLEQGPYSSGQTMRMRRTLGMTIIDNHICFHLVMPKNSDRTDSCSLHMAFVARYNRRGTGVSQMNTVQIAHE